MSTSSALTPADTDASAHTLEMTRAAIDRMLHDARQRGVKLRQPPPEPTTCCGRGCNGCVWEGFYAAAQFWLREAALAVQS